MRTFLRRVVGVALIGFLLLSDVGRFYLNNPVVIVQMAPNAEKEEESALRFPRRMPPLRKRLKRPGVTFFLSRGIFARTFSPCACLTVLRMSA